MKRFFSCCVAGFLLVACASAVEGQAVLYQHTFDGVANDSTPAIQAMDNGTGGPMVDLVAGTMTNVFNAASGFNTVSSVDLSGVDGFTLEYVVTNNYSGITGATFNGAFFGIANSSTANATDGTALYNNAGGQPGTPVGVAVGFQVGAGRGVGGPDFVLDQVSGNGNFTPLFTSNVAVLDDATDGYTVFVSYANDAATGNTAVTIKSSGLATELDFCTVAAVDYASLVANMTPNVSAQGATLDLESITIREGAAVCSTDTDTDPENNDPPGTGPTPNIIVILVDDMGYGDVQVYNPNAQTTTPNIDAMAADGMRFTDAHSPSAVCTPTRYALLTGRYAWRTRLTSGVLDGDDRRLIAADRDTIPKLLKRRNYRTASMGKWHLGMTDSDGLNSIYQNSTDAQRQLGTNDVGFDRWFGIPASLDHIPYCVVSDGALVNMVDDTPSPSYDTWPTQPGGSSPRFIRRGPIAPGFDFEGLMGRLETEVTDYISDHVANHSDEPFFLYHPVPAPHAPWVPDVDTSNLTPEEIYIAFVDQIDQHVGNIMNKLADPNGDGDMSDSIADDTMIVFTSDNGADSRHFSESSSGHDLNLDWRGQKADIHEGGHRMPFIVKWPGNVPAGSVCDETICFTDLFATFAEIVGQRYDDDAGADSFSLRKVLLGEPFASPIRGPVVHHSLNGMFAIREAEWKLVFGTGSGGFSGAAGEGSNNRTDDTPQRLYDLVANPTEILANNQLVSQPAIVTDLHAKLDDIRDNPRSAPVVPIVSVLLGDVDQNGVVNFLDISPFISRLSSGEFLDQADVNRDGAVNFLDISPFIGILSGQ